jgi:hypothetical protein
VHFVGDLHQPLHAGSGEDLGANRVKVRFGSRVTNLHATWDSAVINTWGEDAPTIARRLQAGITAEDVEAIRAGGPYDWMVESHVLAREVAYANFPREAAGDVMTTETLGLLRDLWGDDALPEGATFTDDVSDEDAPDLSGEYATIARPMIETRLLQGGLRLSRVLNDVFATPPVLPQTPTSRLPR